jgi:hypothetical protein
MFVPGVCALHVEASATGRSLVYGGLLDVCVCVCVCVILCNNRLYLKWDREKGFD